MIRRGVTGPGKTHECAADGCHKQIHRVNLLMCWPHWRRVPRRIQRDIWASVGRDDDAYEFAVNEAVEVLRIKETALNGA